MHTMVQLRHSQQSPCCLGSPSFIGAGAMATARPVRALVATHSRAGKRQPSSGLSLAPAGKPRAGPARTVAGSALGATASPKSVRVGMGTASFPMVHEAAKEAVLAAMEVGYRHLDTAVMYGTERPVGGCGAGSYVPGRRCPSRPSCGARRTTRTSCSRPSGRPSWPPTFPKRKEDAVPFDVEGVWRAMEECQRLGLAKAIGVSNFTTKHLDKVLAVATIPPAVNQVELNPVWQQRTLRAYCAEKGIHIAAFSPLGGQNWDGTGNAVLESEVLARIAKARGKTVAQVALRWIYEQEATLIVKSYNKERLKQNLEIFDWELTDEDRLKISQIPQKKVMKASGMFLQEGEFTCVDPDDLDVVEE